MRRTMLLLSAMVLILLVASGVAWAVNKVGTNGPDTLRGTNGADTLVGLGGNDTLYSLRGKDILIGGRGKDVVLGGNAHHSLGGDKLLVGGTGNDAVIGGRGSDIVVGGKGNDFMQDGEFTLAVPDKLSGGAGNDVIDIVNISGVRRDAVTCGNGFDRVLADRKDVVTPNCERVFFGERKAEAFLESVPQSFFEGLNQRFF